MSIKKMELLHIKTFNITSYTQYFHNINYFFMICLKSPSTKKMYRCSKMSNKNMSANEAISTINVHVGKYLTIKIRY